MSIFGQEAGKLAIERFGVGTGDRAAAAPLKEAIDGIGAALGSQTRQCAGWFAAGSGDGIDGAALQIDDAEHQLIERQLAHDKRSDEVDGFGNFDMPTGLAPDIK